MSWAWDVLRLHIILPAPVIKIYSLYTQCSCWSLWFEVMSSAIFYNGHTMPSCDSAWEDDMCNVAYRVVHLFNNRWTVSWHDTTCIWCKPNVVVFAVQHSYKLLHFISWTKGLNQVCRIKQWMLNLEFF